MKKRSGFAVMARLIGLVKPLSGYMSLAVLMGLVGHLCAAFITIFGGYGVLAALRFEVPFTLTTVFISVLVFALLRDFCGMRSRRATTLSHLNYWHFCATGCSAH